MKKEAEALSKLAEDALVARGGSNDFDLAWVNQDFLQGPKGREFVPFTFSLDPAKVNGGDVDGVLARRASGRRCGRCRRKERQKGGASLGARWPLSRLRAGRRR